MPEQIKLFIFNKLTFLASYSPLRTACLFSCRKKILYNINIFQFVLLHF